MKKTKTPQFNVRRELVELECRDCGANLEMLDDTYAHCKYCGQKYIVNVLLERIPDATVPTPAPEPEEKKNPIVQVILGYLSVRLILGIGSMVVFLIAAIIVGVVSSSSSHVDSDYSQSNRGKISGGSSAKETDMENTKDWDGFQSQTMQQVVYQIFGKSVDEVTDEELASIRYFSLVSNWPDDTYTVTYSMADYRDYVPDYHEKLPDYTGTITFAYSQEFRNTLKTVTVPTMGDKREHLYGDVANFTNINALNLGDYEYLDFSKLPNLTLLDGDGDDISELIDAGLPIEQIEVLRFDDADLTGIEKFTGLKQLYLKYIDAEYIDDVAKCTGLETLYCIDCFEGTSYNPLKTLTGLKTFYIRGTARGIKDLSVISAFTNLENLSIVDTDILTISFIKDLKKLKTLRLADNDELEDFKGLGNLQSLECIVTELFGIYSDNAIYKEMEKLKNLKTLILNGADYADFLYELPQLEILDVDSSDKDLLSAIRNMKKLKELTLDRCYTSFWEYDNFDYLKELPQLRVLNINNTEFKEAVSGIFQVESLEELHLTYCTFWEPPQKILFSDKLRVLDLRGTKLKGLYYSEECIGYEEESVAQGVLNAYSKAPGLEEMYLDRSEIKHLNQISQMKNLKVLSLQYCELTDWQKDALKNATSLESLYLSGNNITDIDFAKTLTNLQILEIVDCYVTDLSPLLNCPKLRYVDASENPIAVNPIVDAMVIN